MHLNLNQKSTRGRLGAGGFTLVEILIVVAIIGMIAVIAIPNYMRYREASRRSVCIANLKQMQDAKTQWAFEKSQGPSAVPLEADLVGPSNYLKEKPACPGGGDDYMTTIQQVDQKATCTLGALEGHTL